MHSESCEGAMAERNSFSLQMLYKAASWLFIGADASSRLDLDVMPDRVKRDLGFMDGRDPRYEDERLR